MIACGCRDEIALAAFCLLVSTRSHIIEFGDGGKLADIQRSCRSILATFAPSRAECSERNLKCGRNNSKERCQGRKYIEE